LDDTFLDHTSLNPVAYSMLVKLHTSGLMLLAATGRPAAWGEVLARQWPVAAVISENGAVAHARSGQRTRCLDTQASHARQHMRRELARIAADVEREFPELVSTDDAHARISDVSYDVGEHHQLPRTTLSRVVSYAELRGAFTSVSSVHLHLTLDKHDKATGALHLLREHFQWDTSAARLRFAFIGDSGNDAPCFAAFHTSVGVANLTGRPTVMPRYIAQSERSRGFVEFAEAVLAARG
jgi:HAD superfamily hydrolase (TIGR01484 family)